MTLVVLGIILEIFGFSLALIEIRFNHLADRLENWIDDSEEKMQSMGQRFSKTIGFQILSSVATLFVLTIGIWWVLDQAGAYIGHEAPNSLWIWIPFFTSVGLPTLVVLFYLLAEFVDFLNRFSGGRATGSLGVIIGVVSLGIETIGLLSLDCPQCP